MNARQALEREFGKELFPPSGDWAVAVSEVLRV